MLRSVRPCRAAPETAQDDAAAKSPEESPEFGRQTYKPATYNELISDAANAMVRALDAGTTRMEVEFPAVPTTDCALPPMALKYNPTPCAQVII